MWASIKDPFGKYLTAYLNGKKLDTCFFADEEKGLVRCFKTTDGKLILSGSGSDREPIEEERYGAVRLEVEGYIPPDMLALYEQARKDRSN